MKTPPQEFSYWREMVGGLATFAVLAWIMAMVLAVGVRVENPHAYVPVWIFAPIRWLVGLLDLGRGATVIAPGPFLFFSDFLVYFALCCPS